MNDARIRAVADAHDWETVPDADEVALEARNAEINHVARAARSAAVGPELPDGALHLAGARGPVLYGVDVSQWQGTVNWSRVHAAGVTFAFRKVSEGRTYLDPQQAANRSGIKAAGLVRGAYHFLVSTSPAADQADWFLAHSDLDEIHALDVEAPGPLDVAGFVHRWRARVGPGKPLLIYTNGPLWRNRARVSTSNAAQFGLAWIAGYRPGLYVPGSGSLSALWAKVGPGDNGGIPDLGWTRWQIMQHTAAAVVPGIPAAADGDAFLGTLDQLKALAGGNGDTMSQADVDAINAHTDAAISAALGGNRTVGGAVFAATFGPKTAGDLLSEASRADEALAAVQSLAAAVAALPSAAANASAVTAALTGIADEVANAVAAKLGNAGGIVVQAPTVDELTAAFRGVLVDVLGATRLSAQQP